MEVRNAFGDTPCGWPQDAIDGALYALLNAGAIRAFDKIGKSVVAKSLERSKIAYTTFKGGNGDHIGGTIYTGKKAAPGHGHTYANPERNFH
ncbi:MAG TPA: hypothetical protein PK966_09065 [Syntrophorhabdaceae bacterium]|nr:hypothetical protein [Syntrophorhabdaceae bacterium]